MSKKKNFMSNWTKSQQKGWYVTVFIMFLVVGLGVGTVFSITGGGSGEFVSGVSSSYGEETEQGTVIEVPDDPRTYTIGELEEAKSSFGQAFAFVSTTATESRSSSEFTKVSTNGAFGPLVGAKYTSSGNYAVAGKKCAVGDYIRLFTYEKNSDGKFQYNGDLFQNLYKKEASDDLVHFKDWDWITSRTYTWYYGYTCLHKESTTEKPSPVETVDLAFGTIKVTNGGDLTEGQIYEIVGNAYVKGKCDGCVIETGLDFYGQPLSVTAESDREGACGDDKTVGVKFNAENEWVTFKLKDTASKTGSYRVGIGAYSGCGGSELDKTTFQVSVEAPSGGDDGAGDDGTGDDGAGDQPTLDDPIGGDWDNTDDSSGGDVTTGDEPTLDDIPDSDPIGTPVVSPSVQPSAPATGIADYFDYKNNTGTAIGLTALIVIILGLVVYLIFGGKKQQGGL